MHLLIGDSLNVSRSTAGRVIRSVTSLLCTLRPNFIKFPAGQDVITVKNGFFKVAGFPNVLGCIDGTFIRLRRPIKDEQDFVNRKGYHSLNVQMCCDYKFKVTSCAASWPGSVHDSRLFWSSELSTKNSFWHSVGRFGISLPLFSYVTIHESKFASQGKLQQGVVQNQSINRADIWNTEEAISDLTLRNVCPARTSSASVVLHTIGIDRGDIINLDEIVLQGENVQPEPILHAHRDGAAVRHHIMNTYFS